jgi:hypothetical protein
MPGCHGDVPFFVVFRGSAMGRRRPFMQLGGSAVFFVHSVSSLWKRG